MCVSVYIKWWSAGSGWSARRVAPAVLSSFYAAKLGCRWCIKVGKSKLWPMVIECGGSIHTLHYKLGARDFKYVGFCPHNNHTLKLHNRKQRCYTIGWYGVRVAITKNLPDHSKYVWLYHLTLGQRYQLPSIAASSRLLSSAWQILIRRYLNSYSQAMFVFEASIEPTVRLGDCSGRCASGAQVLCRCLWLRVEAKTRIDIGIS